MTTSARDVVVFVGPSLPAEEVVAALPSAVIRPPAALGDVLACLEHRPAAVALIDGRFERVPAVWHKELLWALSRGVPVFGGASMGALRAAELAPFGMVGVGAIYEQCASGALEDDDEVAVAHLGPDDGHRAVSDAMVAIRATAAAAQVAGRLTADEAAQVCAAAKARFYPERHWSRAVADVVDAGGLTPARAAAVCDWVQGGGWVDAKADDARALLQHVADWLDRAPSTPRSDWAFEQTMYWAKAMQDLGRHRVGGAGAGTAAEQVLDELRLRPDEHREVRDEAFVRTLAAALADARAVSPRPEETQRALDALRLELGLHAPADVDAWLDAQDMSVADLRSLVTEDAQLDWAESLLRRTLTGATLNVLRRRGRHGELARVAGDKQRTLEAHGLDGSATGDGAEDDAVLAWWFRTVQGRDVPDDLDGHLLREGLGDRAEFLRALRREYWHRHLLDAT